MDSASTASPPVPGLRVMVLSAMSGGRSQEAALVKGLTAPPIHLDPNFVNGQRAGHDPGVRLKGDERTHVRIDGDREPGDADNPARRLIRKRPVCAGGEDASKLDYSHAPRPGMPGVRELVVNHHGADEFAFFDVKGHDAKLSPSRGVVYNRMHVARHACPRPGR